jgi:hypothetical protein
MIPNDSQVLGAWPQRPLTLEELEAIHAPQEPQTGWIPGLPRPKPRRALALIALLFGGVGFGIAAIHHVAKGAPEPRAAASESRRGPARSTEPLPSLPAIAEARALPELERPTRSASSRRTPAAAPEPAVIWREPLTEWSSPPGVIAAEVDAERARDYERRRAEERENRRAPE